MAFTLNKVKFLFYWTRLIHYLVEDLLLAESYQKSHETFPEFHLGGNERTSAQNKIKWTVYIVLGLFLIKFCLLSILIYS